MIPNDQPARKQIIGRMIDHLYKIAVLEENTAFTEWEMNFVGSVQEQFLKKGDLTSRQCEILERLYVK